MVDHTQCEQSLQLLDTEVVRITSELIRIDTTNHGQGHGWERPAAEYVAEQLTDAGLNPRILESAPGRANVLARVHGTDPDRPALLVHGHLDVVPAESALWSVPPFAGAIEADLVWGRGALDMKQALAMTLATLRHWHRTGTRPQRSLVLAFTADEEDSAAYGAAWLAREHSAEFAKVSDAIGESGGHTYHAHDLQGAPVRLYPIGAGERGTAWLHLTAYGQAGHGSRMRPPFRNVRTHDSAPGAGHEPAEASDRVDSSNAVSALAAAVTRIAAHSWPVRLTDTTRSSLHAISAALGMSADVASANFDAQRDLDGVLDRMGPAAELLGPTVRNSTNPTMLAAGDKLNVIPQRAHAGVDGRVVPGTDAEFRATLDQLTGPRVDWEFAHRSTPVESPVDTATFAAMRAAVHSQDPQAHVVPVCLSGGTDAKHFAPLGITGYGFVPLGFPSWFDQRGLVHGVDERVPVTALQFGVRVLDRFLRTVA
ncbi:M20/M25/M40 family metallo-hydrolase [Lipingzhangella sp. LS1_29]|uniref:M20/M25/M40 family metallo-hydrolase n=1 Tax=Lipingzhangella rawalii TaxID=2055835 RepID=A0ABU2H3W6_9ACTN|nr:M20/M25/M40 family metallo-hydrolase [Lipingzhangella rawalii]MDS1269544.1 M20/M25/M40 family metallo-hydrolase [Lipingzhangella rawalii]